MALRRKTTEVKWHFHYFIMIRAIFMIYHCWCWSWSSIVLSGFFNGMDTLFSLFGRKSLCTTLYRVKLHLPWWGNIYIDYLEFCTWHFSLPSFIYSWNHLISICVDSWTFCILAYNPMLLILLLKLFKLWPLELFLCPSDILLLLWFFVFCFLAHL